MASAGRPPKDTHVQVRCASDEKRRWEEAAAQAQADFSDWLRDRLNEAVLRETGGVDAVADAEFGEALDRVRLRGAYRTNADAIRAAVVTYRGLLDEAGIDPAELLDRTRKAQPGGPAKRR